MSNQSYTKMKRKLDATLRELNLIKEAAQPFIKVINGVEKAIGQPCPRHVMAQRSPAITWGKYQDLREASNYKDVDYIDGRKRK